MDKLYFSQLSSRYIYLTERRKVVFKILEHLWRLIECPEFDSYSEFRKSALRANYEAFSECHTQLCVACKNLYRLSKTYPHWC